MSENENENAEIIENELPGKFEDVKVLARLPELKGNKSLYEAFKSEAKFLIMIASIFKTP